MATTEFTVEDLKRILLQGAGAAEGVDLDGDILDTDFEDLGYESLALLETGSRIERELGISLDETELSEARTPRQLIALVNGSLVTADAA
ncbi:acyl carrier protein [Streptomyces sp. HNM0574]|uniref:acyl carrier protein n=1 Tax=Streptomyces sp. HNM0574 TaxID=2714954 RepID=UPI00146EF128|nr:acyl carrier protein [Streptomyces sp. HNM0574]NLU68564.1 acyl carrier protein [Streptomyces sp. HNM0574]